MQPKLGRKRRIRWPRFLRGYKHRRALHEHEERVVLRMMIADGGEGSAATWDAREPGRFDAVLLTKVFGRLRDKQQVKLLTRRTFRQSAVYEITPLGRGASSTVFTRRTFAVYEITPLGRQRVREEDRHGKRARAA